MICNYCTKEAELVRGNVIYPHRTDLYNLNFWKCFPCNAHVGCHKPNKEHGHTGTEPYGLLANGRLRYYKMQAHKYFDPIWKDGPMTRKEAYTWLAIKLNIPLEDCHIGNFGLQRTKRVIEIIQSKQKEATKAYAT